MIGNIEEIAFKKEFITDYQFYDLVNSMPNCAYQEYLLAKYPMLV